MNLNQDTLKNSYQLLLTALVLGFALGWLAHPSQKPKKEVCKLELAELKLLKMQHAGLQQECAKEKQDIILECEQKGREESLKKLEAYKAVCMNLRCEICEKAGK
jgi:hypothetical protein